MSFIASSIESESVETFTFEVIAEDGGEVVTYSNQSWKAQWWIQGGENPKATYESDKWGVWRPAN